MIASLQHQTTLRELDISNTGVMCDVVNDLSKILQSNTMLQGLKLYDNFIDASLSEILSSLKRLKSLVQLNLNNYVVNEEVAEQLLHQ